MRVQFKNLKGEQTSLDLDPNLTIQEAKEAYGNHLNIPPASIKLIHQGKVMANEETLLQHNIKEDQFLVAFTAKDKQNSAQPERTVHQNSNPSIYSTLSPSAISFSQSESQSGANLELSMAPLSLQSLPISAPQVQMPQEQGSSQRQRRSMLSEIASKRVNQEMELKAKTLSAVQNELSRLKNADAVEQERRQEEARRIEEYKRAEIERIRRMEEQRVSERRRSAVEHEVKEQHELAARTIELEKQLEEQNMMILALSEQANAGQNQLRARQQKQLNNLLEVPQIDLQNLTLTEAINLQGKLLGLQTRLQDVIDQKNISDLGSQGCVICMSAHRNILLMPCSHLVACGDCSQRIRECPVCRAKVDEKLKVHMP